MPAAGYSQRSLIEKLGIKEGFKCLFVNEPETFRKGFGKLPKNVEIHTRPGEDFNYIHLFVTDRDELARQFPDLKKSIVPNGQIWISWPKGSSKSSTNLNENIVRDLGLEVGLVDIKVVAVDDVWSGLKFVIRTKDR